MTLSPCPRPDSIEARPSKPRIPVRPGAGVLPKSEPRFWAKVQVTAGCWWWTGYRNKRDGYGRVTCRDRGRGICKSRLAHVIAYELTRGPVPSGLELRHLCGEGCSGCVRPDHMVPGTRRENIADTVAMGRTTKGERNRHAKLTSGQVRAIRGRLVLGESVDDLAAAFGVTDGNIRMIATGRTWRHLLPAAVRP